MERSQNVMFEGAEVELVQEDVFEFEYDEFSIFFNLDQQVWYARHEDGEDDFDDMIIIQDQEITADLPMDVFGMELTPEVFQELQLRVSAEIDTNKQGE